MSARANFVWTLADFDPAAELEQVQERLRAALLALRRSSPEPGWEAAALADESALPTKAFGQVYRLIRWRVLTLRSIATPSLFRVGPLRRLILSGCGVPTVVDGGVPAVIGPRTHLPPRARDYARGAFCLNGDGSLPMRIPP